MTDDIRKAPLAAALRAVIDELIATADLERLCDFADRVQDAAWSRDTEAQNALVYALREARGHVADDKRTAGRLAEARRRRDGESDEAYAARMGAFGLDDE